MAWGERMLDGVWRIRGGARIAPQPGRMCRILSVQSLAAAKLAGLAGGVVSHASIDAIDIMAHVKCLPGPPENPFAMSLLNRPLNIQVSVRGEFSSGGFRLGCDCVQDDLNTGSARTAHYIVGRCCKRRLVTDAPPFFSWPALCEMRGNES